MDVNDLMNRITDYTVAKKEAEKQALIDKYNRIDELKDKVDEKLDKITDLIKLGNHALKNNIIKPINQYNDCSSLANRGYGYFFTNGISHQLGFVWDHESKKITHLGIAGGGACNYNLKVNEEEFEVTGDEEYVLTRFVNEFDKFEKDLFNYINLAIQKK